IFLKKCSDPNKQTKIQETLLDLEPSTLTTKQIFSKCGSSSSSPLELLITSFMQINTTRIGSVEILVMQINTTNMKNLTPTSTIELVLTNIT
ncbi:37669_t:CDS:1, partial [Gigaspora margarita]